LFNRPKPTAGCSANGGGGGRRIREEEEEYTGRSAIKSSNVMVTLLMLKVG
jgi:hypothetical protein